MGSVISLNGKWRAQVRRKGHPAQCKTFAKKAQADAWVRQVEADMDAGGNVVQGSTLKVRDLIQEYRKLRDRSRPISDSSNEHYMLKALERGLGDKLAARLTPDDFVSYATLRREEGAGPYTINMDVSKLGTVMRYGGAALRVALPDAVGAARPLLSHLRLIGGGNKRERRPTEDELGRILVYLAEHYGLVYAEAVAFAAVSAMRRGEICSIGHEEIDAKNRIVQVWRKHPRRGKVLESVPLLGEAWEIVERQPRGEPEEVLTLTDRGEVLVKKTRVFPIAGNTLSGYFTDTCRALAIPDLHLHDMRHEGTSRLFEEGFQIQEVALVTGHKNWAHLKRYTQLKPESLSAPAVKRPAAGPGQSTPQRP